MKKIIALITALVLILGTAVLPLHSVAATNAETSTARLKGLGILPEDFSAAGSMNRGEFAKLLAVLYGGASAGDTGNSFFNDIGGEVDSETRGAVNLLASYGILKGNPGAVYQAGDPLSMEEAATALVRVLGYEYVAEKEGGYPIGYLSNASKIGLTNGLNGSETVNTAVAVMLDRALDIKVLNRTEWGNDAFKLSPGKETLMEALLKIETKSGVLYAVGDMALDASYAVGEGNVRIGDMTLHINADARWSAQELLGRTVKAYCREENGADVLCYLQDTQKERVLTVGLNDDITFENGTLTYVDQNGKKCTVSTIGAPYIVYNGRPITKIPDMGTNGTITCISDTRNEYDIIIIEDYKTHVVNQVADNGNMILSRYAKTALPRLEEAEELYILDNDGNSLTTADIAENDVLSVAESEDSSFILIRLSRRNFLGKLETISGNSQENYRLRISTAEYEVTPEFYTYLADKETSTLLGMTDYFYTDVFGKVAHVGSGATATKDKLGYLVGISENSGALDRPRIRVFNQDGIFEVLTLADRMSLNGSRKVGSVSAAEWFAANGTTGQLISYRTNSQGEVSRMETAAVQPRDGLYKLCDLTGVRYRSSQKSFRSQVILRDDTYVFTIPDSANMDNESYYKVSDHHTFSSGRSYNNISAYALTMDAYTADVVVYQENYTTGTGAAIVAMADEIIIGLDADGASEEQLNLWNVSAASITLSAKDGVSLNTTDQVFSGSLPEGMNSLTLGRGDIIRYTPNSSGEIASYQMIYSYELDTWFPTSNPYTSSSSTDEYRYGMGVPEGLDGTILRVRYPNDSVEYFDIASTKILITCRIGGRIITRPGTMAELVQRNVDKVFVYAPQNIPNMIYAYEL